MKAAYDLRCRLSRRAKASSQ